MQTLTLPSVWWEEADINQIIRQAMSISECSKCGVKVACGALSACDRASDLVRELRKVMEVTEP